MIHGFFLSELSDNPRYDYVRFVKKAPNVALHDDLVRYVDDSLWWFSSFNPAKKMEAQTGLNFYGPTIIKSVGARDFFEIANAWSSLFQKSPRALQLTGGFEWTEGQGYESGRYSEHEFDRDEILASFNRLASMCLRVAESNDSEFIVHLGI